MTTTSKRDFLDRLVKELNLDLTDPFTLIFANAVALADTCDALRKELTAQPSAIADCERDAQRDAEAYRNLFRKAGQPIPCAIKESDK